MGGRGPADRIRSATWAGGLGAAWIGQVGLPTAGGRFRAVIHYWIGDDDIERTIAVVREVVGGEG